MIILESCAEGGMLRGSLKKEAVEAEYGGQYTGLLSGYLTSGPGSAVYKLSDLRSV